MPLNMDDLAAIASAAGSFVPTGNIVEVPEPDPEPEELPIYTADLETDPFALGEMIYPFAAGLYDGSNYHVFWNARTCVAKLFEQLERMPAGIIYIHNLGGFDFFWMLKWFIGESLIRNGRVVATYCKAADGKLHQLRDSYAIMPFALKEYKKDGIQRKKEIDINKLHRSRREKHREEIKAYLKMDCVSLHELCVAFRERFGDKLTVGSAAMTELQETQPVIPFTSLESDKVIREQFYCGGRVQCFRGGFIKEPLKVYDVNSMYPHAMRSYEHPICRLSSITAKLTRDTCFVVTEGWNNGAFPYREKNGSLSFTRPYGIFGVSIHEWDAARRLGLFKPKRVIAAYNFIHRRTFATFVDKFYALRKEAKISGDGIGSLFYKYILNSSYGKFAQDSAKFCDYQIRPDNEDLSSKDPCNLCDEDTCAIHWRAEMVVPECGIIVWKRNNPKPVFYNVATGASITGASRAVLMDAIAKADSPVYCDTDSLICRDLSCVPLDDNELGAWKLEATGSAIAVAGKKMYALFDGKKCIKMASKGVVIPPEMIRKIATSPDAEYLYQRESPSMKMDGTFSFLERKVRRTINPEDTQII